VLNVCMNLMDYGRSQFAIGLAASLAREVLFGLGAALDRLAGNSARLLVCRDDDILAGFANWATVEESGEWGHWRGSLDSAQRLLAGEGALLVVSPCLGPASTRLLGDFQRRIGVHPNKICVAASRLHCNLHPSWLIRDSRGIEGDEPIFHAQPERLWASEFMLSEGLAFFPDASEIGGSQDVPPLYLAHGSLVYIPEILRGKKPLGEDSLAVTPLDHDLFDPIHVLWNYTATPLICECSRLRPGMTDTDRGGMGGCDGPE